MKIDVVHEKLDTVASELIAVGFFSPVSGLPDSLKAVDEKLGGAISHVISEKEFEGELYQLRMVSTLAKIPAGNILLVGLGKKEDVTLETLRRVSGHVARAVRDGAGITSFSVLLHELDIPKTTKDERAQAVAEGLMLGSYQFIKYKTVDKDKIKVLTDVQIIGTGIEEPVRKGIILGECQNHVRDLANEPGSNLKPQDLANAAKNVEQFGVKVTVYDKKQIEKLGLTALLAVNRGSVNEPRFVVMEYNGGGKTKTALVGKGITFDSGGLNIKPGDSMLTMNSDMCGAAVVIGSLRAAAMLKLPINLVGVFASTENMPGMDAYKPGDIVPTYSGKTIEVANTDAEGRVVLSDALAYTEKVLKPDRMIDFATLTGACVVALGSVCAGIMGKDETLISKLIASGNATGERVWQLPFFQEYHDQVKSEVGDVRNLGAVRKEAGAITAGTFLAAFVEKTPWAHIDIAGTSWSEVESGYTKKGGTGFGVRMVIHALANDEMFR